jgi:hypothetical protein
VLAAGFCPRRMRSVGWRWTIATSQQVGLIGRGRARLYTTSTARMGIGHTSMRQASAMLRGAVWRGGKPMLKAAGSYTTGRRHRELWLWVFWLVVGSISGSLVRTSPLRCQVRCYMSQSRKSKRRNHGKVSLDLSNLVTCSSLLTLVAAFCTVAAPGMSGLRAVLNLVAKNKKRKAGSRGEQKTQPRASYCVSSTSHNVQTDLLVGR